MSTEERMLRDRIDWFVIWLDVEKGYSHHTVDGYRRDLLEFADFTGNDTELVDIDSLTVRAFVYQLNSKNKSSSVARKLSALRTFFRFLLRNGIVRHDPLAAVAMPKQGKYMPVFLTVDEVFNLMEAPGEDDTFCDRDVAILELLYSTGMRVAELTAGNLADFDFKAAMVRVTG